MFKPQRSRTSEYVNVHVFLLQRCIKTATAATMITTRIAIHKGTTLSWGVGVGSGVVEGVGVKDEFEVTVNLFDISALS